MGDNGKTRDKKGRFLNGTVHSPGRPKGSKNITTTEIKQAFLDVFERLGGVEALFTWVEESKFNRKEFFRMLLALLPKKQKLEHEAGETLQIIYGYRNADGSVRTESDNGDGKSS